MTLSRLIAATLAFTPLFIVFSGSHAASFDCDKASNKAEILICGVPELSALDINLDKLYKKVRQTQSDRITLRDNQRAWLQRRNQCEHVDCLRREYQHRITELEQLTRSTKPRSSSDHRLAINNDNPQKLHDSVEKFRIKTAAWHLENILKLENEIATLPNKNIAVLHAAGRLNHMFMAKKESREHEPQQLTSIFAIATFRLALLSQAADMPPAVITCHFNEASALEKMSRGLTANASNCRSDAYGSELQAQALRETLEPSWDHIATLTLEWVTNTFMYAEDMQSLNEHWRPGASRE